MYADFELLPGRRGDHHGADPGQLALDVAVGRIDILVGHGLPDGGRDGFSGPCIGQQQGANETLLLPGYWEHVVAVDGGGFLKLPGLDLDTLANMLDFL